jgi:hypothetical protein
MATAHDEDKVVTGFRFSVHAGKVKPVGRGREL